MYSSSIISDTKNNLGFSQSGKSKNKSKMRGIQKDLSPLTTKRIIRRKKGKEFAVHDKEVFDLTAYVTAE